MIITLLFVIDVFDKSYGLDTYVKNSKKLLEDARTGANPFDGFTPEVPSGSTLEPFTADYTKYEKEGLKEVGKCGFVLVAGGLGERLGYNGIKVELPYQTVTETCYLEYYISQILAIQKRYGSPELPLPLAIMVSDDTHLQTIKLLEDNDYFGMEESQIHILKQEKVPALNSNDADLLLQKDSNYLLETKPHGHGDIHSLMHSTGTAESWGKMGIKWVNFFQDTNALGLHSLPAMIGVSISLSLEVNSLAIRRKAKQAVGALVRLKNASTGKTITCNVEYNQLDPLLRSTISKDGDVNDPKTGELKLLQIFN